MLILPDQHTYRYIDVQGFYLIDKHMEEGTQKTDKLLLLPRVQQLSLQTKLEPFLDYYKK
jgi:hypothetical protein